MMWRPRSWGASQPVWGTDATQGPVSAKAYGAVGDSDAGKAGNNSDAFERAIADLAAAGGGELYIPPELGSYRIARPIILTHRNIRIVGAASHRCTIDPSDDFVGDDIISIRQSDCEVSGINVRPRDGIAGIRVQGVAYAYIHDMLFLTKNGTEGEGVGIVLDDRNIGGTLQAGAYFHRIERCSFSRSTFFVAVGIETDAAADINQCVVRDCLFVADEPIIWNHGGGNLFAGNLIQRAGTHGGTGIQCTLGQVFTGNYFEDFAVSVSNVAGHQGLDDNWYDDIDSPIGSNSPELTIVGANDTLIPIVRQVHRLNGSGANRTGCGITAGTRRGQMLTLIGHTWGVQITSGGASGATIIFQASAGNPNFGNAGGATSTMHLIWDADSSAWREISRRTV